MAGKSSAGPPNRLKAMSENQAPTAPIWFRDGRAVAGVAEAGILRAVAQQGHQHDERDGAEHPQGRFAHRIGQRRSKAATFESDSSGHVRP